MKYFMVCIRDRASATFAQPIFVAHLGGAIRSFGDEINRSDQNNQLYKHPEDFDLFHLGYYYDETGAFEELDGGPRQIAVGKDLVRFEAT